MFGKIKCLAKFNAISSGLAPERGSEGAPAPTSGSPPASRGAAAGAASPAAGAP